MSSISQANFEFNIFVGEFKKKAKICSSEIIVSGIPWQIQVHKRKDEQNNFVLDLSLKCSIIIKKLSCAAFAVFKLRSTQTNETLVEKQLLKKEFNKEFRQNTLSEFISWNDLIDPSKKLIVGDKICLAVEIFADPLTSKQPFNRTKIQCTSSIFKIRIDAVHLNTKLNGSFLVTEKVIIRDLEWWVEISKNNNDVGIYLQCNSAKIPIYWSHKVNYKIKMVSADDGKQIKSNQYERSFQKGDLAWGNSNFIPWDEFLKEGKSKNLFFEVEVNIDEAKPSWSHEGDLRNLNGSLQE